MADDPIIILDDSGTEHVFPPGFDPKKAGAIVRQKTASKDVSLYLQAKQDANSPPREDGQAAPAPSGLMSALQSAAHPETAGDMASLLIPSAGAAAAAQKALPAMGKMMPSARTMARGGAEVLDAAVHPKGLADRVIAGLRRFGAEGVAEAAPASDLEFARQEMQAGRLPQATLQAIERAQTPKPMTGIKPVASHPQPAPVDAPQMPPPNVADAPVTQPLGQPRVLTKKATPTAWTPEGKQSASERLRSTDPRSDVRDWHSGAEAGSAEAKSAAGLHRSDAALADRYKFNLANKNSAWLLALAPATRQAVLEMMANQDGEP